MNRNVREGLRWLEQADADAKTARDCLEDGNYDASAFFSQQAAEKGLKGLLYSRGFRALVTHSVVDLIEEASKFNESFKELITQGKELDRHYIGARYPNFYPSGSPHRYYTKEISQTCLNYAGLILSEVKKYLKP
jgi:HEPN domain-containing protein